MDMENTNKYKKIFNVTAKILNIFTYILIIILIYSAFLAYYGKIFLYPGEEGWITIFIVFSISFTFPSQALYKSIHNNKLIKILFISILIFFIIELYKGYIFQFRPPFISVLVQSIIAIILLIIFSIKHINKA